MKKSIFITIFTLFSLVSKANDIFKTDSIPPDSVCLALEDAKELYFYARMGYYLNKVDSINDELFITMGVEISNLRNKNNELETIVENDTKIINNLVKQEKLLTIDNTKKDIIIEKQAKNIKRLKKDKKDAIISGAVVTLFLTLGILAK